jgi:hypothetical protein
MKTWYASPSRFWVGKGTARTRYSRGRPSSITWTEAEWLITPPPRSLATADSVYHLGTSDPTKIKLTRLWWEKEMFI